MTVNYKEMDFKEALEWIMEEEGKTPPSSIMSAIHELLNDVEVDNVLIHEDNWMNHFGSKPENDIELCGEHFFLI